MREILRVEDARDIAGEARWDKRDMDRESGGRLVEDEASFVGPGRTARASTAGLVDVTEETSARRLLGAASDWAPSRLCATDCVF